MVRAPVDVMLRSPLVVVWRLPDSPNAACVVNARLPEVAVHLPDPANVRVRSPVEVTVAPPDATEALWMVVVPTDVKVLPSATVMAPVACSAMFPDVAVVKSLVRLIAPPELSDRSPEVAVQPVVAVIVRSPVIAAAICADTKRLAVKVAVPVAVSVRAPVPCRVMVPSVPPVAAARTRSLPEPVVVISVFNVMPLAVLVIDTLSLAVHAPVTVTRLVELIVTAAEPIEAQFSVVVSAEVNV